MYLDITSTFQECTLRRDTIDLIGYWKGAYWLPPEYSSNNADGKAAAPRLPAAQAPGAAPINWAVIQDEAETGCTTFFLRHEIDTGDTLLRHRLPIGPDDTAGDVHDRTMLEGAELVLQTVQLIESKDYILQAQDDALATPAPKIHRETCPIDWGKQTKFSQSLRDPVCGRSLTHVCMYEV